MAKLYSSLKVFHYPEKLNSLTRTSSTITSPVHIRIKPTNICAHNCWYCAYKKDNLQLGQDMETKVHIPWEKMQEILEDVIEMKVKAITFSGGGDPFYYPYLLDAVKVLADHNISFASLTNGAKLKGELAEVFASHGSWLRISIDGWDEKSYAKYRGVKESEFTKVINNLEAFAKLDGNCHLGISLIIDKDNASHVYEFVKLMKDIGVDNVKLSPCIVSNDWQVSKEYHTPFYQQTKEIIARAIEDFAGEGFEVNDAYHQLNNKFDKSYEWCPYCQVLPIIGADQNIYTCQDKAYNLEEGLLGSIKNQRFKEFWFNDKEKFFKVNPNKHCQHHCVANMKNQMILEYLDLDRDHLGFV